MDDEQPMSNLKRKDTTKGPPLRILSLDGGGVRGFSMIVILESLMHRCFVEVHGRPPRPDEQPKPSDYFDLIAGTGTGGLIALMLGRLRLDLPTCRRVYVRMTRRVFETDKTIAGIPYKTTLFKASKLEEAIRECVAEHTVYEDEGNDGTATGGHEFFGMSPTSAVSPPTRATSVRSNNSFAPSSPVSLRNSIHGVRFGNPNASLHDGREHRTKTAVTAVFKGTPKSGNPILLRSYDSRKEPPPEFSCAIWQAGRATSATGLAFKPIQIGNSVFIDEGAGKYNPAPQLLEEAVINEWPGRECGIFVSIGTGKRPGGTNNRQAEWWEGFVGGSMGSFAEARRRLIAKIEGCEETHQQMLKYFLPKHSVPVENYCRLNVEVGVGEFGMNEWDKIAEISTNTHRYLNDMNTSRLIQNAAAKVGKIELAKRRLEGQEWHASNRAHHPPGKSLLSPPSHPEAVELPGDQVSDPTSPTYNTPRPSILNPPHSYPESVASQDKFTVRSSGEANHYPRASAEMPSYPRRGEDRHSSPNNSHSASPRRSGDSQGRPDAPPVPPKTPFNENASASGSMPPSSWRMNTGNPNLPYPDFDGPPPVVNKLRKPQYNPG